MLHSSLADDTGIIEELVEEMSCSANLYANKSYELKYKGYWLAKFLFSDDRTLISLIFDSDGYDSGVMH